MKRRSLPSRLPKLRIAAFAPLTVLLSMPFAYAATNLGLSNGTFDAGIDPWIASKNLTWGSTGATACGATRCLQLKLDNGITETATDEVKNILPGQFIAASAMMKRDAISGQDDMALGIEFYDSNKGLISTGTRWSYLTGPAKTWGSVKVSAIAPAGTATVKVVVRGKATSEVTAYVDNVVMSKIALEDKGQQAFAARVSAAAIDSNTLYVAANGNPAKFAYYRVSDGKIYNEFKLGNEDVWSMVVGADSAVYFGTASGKLYRYAYMTDPAPQKIWEFKKAVSGTRTIWSLKTGPEKCIYGGLAADKEKEDKENTKTDGFKYCPGKGVTMLNLPTKNGVTATGYHVRSLAVDSGDTAVPGTVYWGMGNPARLYKSAVDGSGLTDLMRIDTAKDYAYYTDFIKNPDPLKNRLFVRLTGKSNDTVVLDTKGDSAGNAVKNINSIGISALSPSCNSTVSPSPCRNTVFYTKDLGTGGSKEGTHLSSYRVDTGEETSLAIQMSAAAAFAYAPFDAPTKLVSVLREPVLDKGKIVRFNLPDLYTPLNEATRESTNFDAPMTASGIRTFAVHNGKTYSSGFVNGAIGIGDGTANPPVVVPEHLQAEGMAILGGNLYIGGYPGAVIKSFPLKPDGLLGEGKTVSDQLGTLYGQNRPFAMLAMEATTAGEVDRLVIATVPKKDEQGALAMYSVGALSPWNVMKEPFTGHSILALARIDDVVYGGTSVWRDIDNQKSPGFAKLFTFDPKSLAIKKVEFKGQVTETSWDKRAITALLKVNRQIWILAEDTVLIYDHDTKEVVKKLKIGSGFSYELFNIAWNAGSMVESNGYVYFSAADPDRTSIYRLNISRPESIETVRTGASGTLKVDADGNIYFINEDRVMKYNMALQ